MWVKNDAANPTHSFKDRVVSVAVARARELGYQTIACASTGNLANSVAAHGAALGLESYVFIPADLEEQKVLATGVYGTRLVAVKGNYDDVNRLCTELSAEREWAFVNINLRPYYAEGSKTLAFEIAEQLGWELPDRCVVPIASGSLFTKIAKGFAEWRELGLVSGELPRMSGAQAEGAPGGKRVRRRSRCLPTGEAPHDRQVAGDRQPSRWPLRAGGGAPQRRLDRFGQRRGNQAGHRPAGADHRHLHRDRRRRHHGGAGKLAERGEIDPTERVVLVITGEGLKTLDAVRGTLRRTRSSQVSSSSRPGSRALCRQPPRPMWRWQAAVHWRALACSQNGARS